MAAASPMGRRGAYWLPDGRDTRADCSGVTRDMFWIVYVDGSDGLLGAAFFVAAEVFAAPSSVAAAAPAGCSSC